MGWMRYRKSREIAGTPKNITVSLVNGKAFISIQNEREVETPMHPSKSSVGQRQVVQRMAQFPGQHNARAGRVLRTCTG
jgi:putative transposase